MSSPIPAPRPTGFFPDRKRVNLLEKLREHLHPKPQPREKLVQKLKLEQVKDAFERGAKRASTAVELPQLSPEMARQLVMARVRDLMEDVTPEVLAKLATSPEASAAPAPAPGPAPVPTLHWDGGVHWQPGVEDLQRELVAAGYMTEAEVATGPGWYGPRTRAAMARLLADLGLPGDGSVCTPEARAGLQQRVAEGPAAASSSSTSPSPSSPVSGPGASTPVPSGPLQTGSVPAMNQYAPAGANGSNYWNGPSNCGPTSAAMVARALGLGGGKSDAELIMQMYRAGGTTRDGSSPEQVAIMMRSLGLPARVVEDPGLPQLDAALAEGKPVIINGDYFATGVPGRDGSRQSGHFCVVEGKDAHGNYIIVDPAGGQRVTFTPQAMTNFFREHAYQGALVVVG